MTTKRTKKISLGPFTTERGESASPSKAGPSKASPSKADPLRTKRKNPSRSSTPRKSGSPKYRKLTTAKRKTKRKVRSSEKKRAAAATIVRFMRQTQHTRKALFLKNLCSDAGVCLSLGTFADEIKKHFGGFTSFAYVKKSTADDDKPPIKLIGAPSENGFINQIEYKHRGYKSYAILKSAKTPEADNLLYEYVVGQYINEVNIVYPCFLETYGYYFYNDTSYWTRMQAPEPITDVRILTDGLTLQANEDYAEACKSSQKIAILIQHLNDIKSLDYLSRDATFVENELMWVLFQLYLPLAKLMENFTHYDLHLNNLYLYEPSPGKYIEYHYFVDTMEPPAITFKSRYMLKIIDYGRSYFNDEFKGVNAKELYDEKICPEADCNSRDSGTCGSHVGFSWLKKLSGRPKSQFYISSQQRNISHDLLPLTRIKENNKEPSLNILTPELNALVNKVVYTDYYGTKENTRKGYPKKIFNVDDAMQCIKTYIMSQKFKDKNEEVYSGKDKLGDLSIYTRGAQMEFTQTVSNMSL